MNYRRIYDELISRSRTRVLVGYVERHHILPKCLGGTDDDQNIVSLSPEEHFVAHQLLVKLNPGNYKLAYAVNAGISEEHKLAISKASTGKSKSEEHRKNIFINHWTKKKCV